ncbi:MAG: protein jag [Clostridia bacterium]|nr:protein jag [Clostridia bacterium]
MENFVETEASSVDLAVEKALVELNTTADKVDVEVLSKGGLFAKAKVKVTLKNNVADKLGEFLNGTLERMGLVSRAKIEEANGTIYATISGDDSGVAIGYRGEALDAFQYLAATFLNEQKGEYKKVVVDSENYRDKRKDTLTALALRLAEKSVRLRRKIALEPMNPFERRIIHSALADSELASTESEGEEPSRYIVIIPKGVELKDNRPIKNGERDERRGGKNQKNSRRRDDNRSRRDRKPRERKPYDEEEVEDGNVYRGYFTGQDDFVKPTAQGGPPKYKSFVGKKRF